MYKKESTFLEQKPRSAVHTATHTTKKSIYETRWARTWIHPKYSCIFFTNRQQPPISDALKAGAICTRPRTMCHPPSLSLSLEHLGPHMASDRSRSKSQMGLRQRERGRFGKGGHKYTKAAGPFLSLVHCEKYGPCRVQTKRQKGPFFLFWTDRRPTLVLSQIKNKGKGKEEEVEEGTFLFSCGLLSRLNRGGRVRETNGGPYTSLSFVGGGLKYGGIY